VVEHFLLELTIELAKDQAIGYGPLATERFR
jgi:hypothetical protein